MLVSREIDTSGVILTHFGGEHTYVDAVSALDNLIEITHGNTSFYEIVIHDSDLRLTISDKEKNQLRSKVFNAFSTFQKGALALVSETDMMFGICRQFEMMMNIENVNIAISVFRSEQRARRWIAEKKHFSSLVNGTF